MKQLIRDFLEEQNILKFKEENIATNELKSINNEVILSGNRLGLVMLADYILNIALSENGSHVHLDQSNFFDDAEHQLIIELEEF